MYIFEVINKELFSILSDWIKSNGNIYHFSLTTLLPALILLKSPFFTNIVIVACTIAELYFSILEVRLTTVTSLPTQTLFLIAYSIFYISAALPEPNSLLNSLDSIVFMVDISKRWWASSTSLPVTSVCNFIFARASLNLTTASSCLTVMGMEFLVKVLLSLAFCLSEM